MRRPALLLALLLPFAVAGCSSAPSPTAPAAPAAPAAATPSTVAPAAEAAPSPTTVTPPAAAPAAEPAPAPAGAACYFGPSRQTTAEGTERPGAELLVRRTPDREASTIVEETVRYDADPGVPPRSYTVVYTVDGDAFTLEETAGAFTGSGRFTAGEPWAWTAWTASYRLPSGISVDAEQRLVRGDDGRTRLRGERSAYGPDGGIALSLVEDLAEIEAAECARRFAALAAG